MAIPRITRLTGAASTAGVWLSGVAAIVSLPGDAAAARAVIFSAASA